MNSTRSPHFLIAAVLFLFATSCEKTNYTPYVPSSGNDTTQNTGTGTPSGGDTVSGIGSLTFFANGDSATAGTLAVDTSAFFGNTIISITGTAGIATTGDTLYFDIQLIGQGVTPCIQFTGTYADTIPTRNTKDAQMLITDRGTDNSFQDQGFTNNYFSATILSNDGKTISGTFSGELPTLPGEPLLMDTVTVGKFRIKL
jgi:hypothetical protein